MDVTWVGSIAAKHPLVKGLETAADEGPVIRKIDSHLPGIDSAQGGGILLVLLNRPHPVHPPFRHVPDRDRYQNGEHKTGDELAAALPPEKRDRRSEGEEAPA